MIHKPIQCKDVCLSFPNKICFADFNVQIPYGSRIALIGRNGSGKSTLLKIFQGSTKPTSGEIKLPDDVITGYVPQVIEEFDSLSGGQRLNKILTQALSLDPNLLLLDEPTNHLDLSNRRSLMRMLKSYPGTLIVVSHDVELLRNCIDTFWHIENGRIRIFQGNYDDYMHEIRLKRISIEQELSRLANQKKDIHQSLMKEQTRSAKSRAKGEKSIDQRKWPTIVSKAKALKAEETSGRKKADINHKKQALNNELSKLRLPETITPTFSLNATPIGNQTLLSIRDGSVGYDKNNPILVDINFSVAVGDRLAIMGDNGSGKSTLVKAILNNPEVIKTGNWSVPRVDTIGYLDQHYGTLSSKKSVLQTMQDLTPAWSHADTRRHLNDFLFRKNEEVNASVATLSGGEKARLTFAQIAARTPKLLILDEITNNLDLETREHIIQVLRKYPGAMIVISHDEDFLKTIGINIRCHIDATCKKLNM
jgi:ATPase subunit of ABC transporter with duplicated ATPase domains